MAGLLGRVNTKGNIYDNTFEGNHFEIVMESTADNLYHIEQENSLPQTGDIRIPKNYSCNLI